MDRVAQMGCLVCGATATVHHVSAYADRPGRFSRSPRLTAPLCPMHHQKVHDPKAFDPVSVEGLSHQGFFDKFGIDLLAEARRLEAESVALGILPVEVVVLITGREEAPKVWGQYV